MQLLCKLLEALAGYDCQPVYQRVKTPLAIFSHGQAQTTPNGLPAAPSNLVATNVTAANLLLQWQDNASDETGYEVLWQGVVKLLTLPAGSTSAFIGGLQPSTSYFYQVIADYGQNFSTSSLISTSTGAATDVFSGDRQLATDILNGNAHLLIVGDSIQGGMIPFYPRDLSINPWQGYGNIGPDIELASIPGGPFITNNPIQARIPTFPLRKNSPDPLKGENPQNVVINIYNDTQSIVPDDNTLANSYAGRTYQFQFNAGTTSNTGNDELSNQIYSVGMNYTDNADFGGNGFNWISNTNSTVTAKVSYWANPNGLSDVQVIARINTVPVATNVIHPNTGTGWQTTPLTFPASVWNNSLGYPYAPLTFDFRVPDGTAIAQDSNFVLGGVNFETNHPGFVMGAIQKGGKAIDYFNGYSQAAITNTLNFTDMANPAKNNVTMIWLGTNPMQLNDNSISQYKTQLTQFMAKCRVANPNMKFLLISPYDTGTYDNAPAVLGAIPQTLRDLANADPANTLFLNMFGQAGSNDSLYANGYLNADHIHETLSGVGYFAGLLQSMLNSAKL